MKAWLISSTYMSTRNGPVVHVVIGTLADANQKAKEMFDPEDRGIAYMVYGSAPFTIAIRP